MPFKQQNYANWPLEQTQRDGKALFQAVEEHEQKCRTAFDVGLQAPSRRPEERFL